MSSASSTKPDVSTASSKSTAPTSNTNSSNNNNNSSSNSAEQPQTKRQKIEKIKSNNKNGKASKSTTSTLATAATRNKTPPPDIIDTGVIAMLDTTPVNGNSSQQYRCSSLSSSANSISTPSSSNNSPTSTPSSSRTTSLSQLLNVQATANVLPPAAAMSIAKCTKATSSSLNIVATHNTIVGNDSATSGCSSAASSSADEVDRVTLPDLLPSVSRVKLAQAQQDAAMVAAQEDMREFEASLTKQCLCGVSERTLRKPFQSHYSLDANGQKRIANLAEWPTEKLLQFLSNLQLLFDIYLKQNSKGFICARIMDVCDVLIRNDHNLIDEIIVLAGYSNAYVQFLAGRVLASFLVIAKQEMDDNWLKKLVDNLFNFERLDHVAVQKIHFSLEIIKRIVEWKDVDLHPLEDEIVDTQTGNMMGMNSAAASDGLDTHGYLHFQQQQPTLDTNYFAVQFRDPADTNVDHDEAEDEEDDEAEQDDDDDDDDDDNDDEEDDLEHGNSAHTHARHSHNHNISQMQQHFGAYALHGAAMQSSDYLTAINYPPAPHVTHAAHAEPLFATAHPHSYHHHAHAQVHYDALAHFGTSSSAATTSTMPAGAASATESGMPASPAAAAALLSSGCHIITLTDSESFDTTHLKGITIKILENKWPALVKNMSALIVSHMDIDHAEHCILNFLQLWENIISVKANLSVVETRPFYAQLDKFELLLNQQHLSCTVYKQMLCLFNEALCYGSTLALQDMLPDETCRLAHQIVRHVKDARILDSMPRRQPENVVSLLGFKQPPFVYADGTLHSQTQSQLQLQPHSHSQSPTHHSIINTNIPASSTTYHLPNSHYHHTQSLITGGDEVVIEMDKTILQKMVLLVLKSIAVTVKEIRSDSSDSSIDSRDYDAYQDMVLIERSIRDVLRKLESFIKHKLEFHPECHFSKILIHLFDDQDDHLIEAMVCTLDVTAGISFRNNAFPELVNMLNPVYTFLEFLKMISNSSDLLLDLLVSNETCFLLYLLRYLKYIRANWEMFVHSCQEYGMGASTLDEAMTVLIRLRLHISRLVAQQLYPYDISPVLRLLESCEGLYEGNDRSLT